MTLPILAAVLPTTGLLSWNFQRSPTHTHNGIDLPAKEGTPVHAAAAGHVTHASSVFERGFSGYGAHVVLAHGGVWTLYAHLRDVHVLPGELVKEGQQIGTVGNTAFTTADPAKHFEHGGYHLHFEVSPRAYPQPSESPRLDPVAWLLGHPQPVEPTGGDDDVLHRLTTETNAADFLALAAVFLGTRWLISRGKHA